MEEVIEGGGATEAPPVDVKEGAESAPPTAPTHQTLAEGGKPEGVAPPPPDWPADWHEKAAAGDIKKAEKLKTMGSPAELANSYFELQKKMDSTKRIPELPKNPTPEQVAEYDKAIGVPDAPDKYNLELGDGHIWGDADKTKLEEFAKFAHEGHMPEKYAKLAVAGYAHLQRQFEQEFADRDKAFKHQSYSTLMKKWGTDYAENENAVGLFVNSFGDSVARKLLYSRSPDGTVLGDDPEVLEAYAQVEKARNPAAVLLPQSGGDPSQTVDDQWAEALDVRRKDPAKFWSKEYQKKFDKLADVKAAQQEQRERRRA